MPRMTKRGKFFPISGVALIGALGLTLAVAPSASAATVVIDKLVGLAPAAAGKGWAAHPDQDGGTEKFVEGPATPPAGTGSLRVGLPAGGARALIFTVPNPGSGKAAPGDVGPITAVAWGDLAGSSYSTYTREDTNTADSVVSLKFVGYQKYNAKNPLLSQGFTTLNFEPSRNGAVTTKRWQHWKIDEKSTIWQSNSGGDKFCVQASACTLAEFAAHYPQGAWGQVQIGLNVAGATSFVDDVTIAEGDTTFGYNFEAPQTPPPSASPTSSASPPFVPGAGDTGDDDTPVTVPWVVTLGGGLIGLVLWRWLA